VVNKSISILYSELLRHYWFQQLHEKNFDDKLLPISVTKAEKPMITSFNTEYCALKR